MQFLQFQNNQNTMIFAVQNTWNTDVLSTEGRSSRVLPLCKTSCDSCSLRQCRPKILKLTAAQVPRGRTASDRIKLKGVAGLSALQGIAIFVLSISHVGSSWGLYKDDVQWSSCDWNRGFFFCVAGRCCAGFSLFCRWVFWLNGRELHPFELII